MKILLYILRWQLSTPILALFVWWLKDYGSVISFVVANFVGALIFYTIDKKNIQAMKVKCIKQVPALLLTNGNVYNIKMNDKGKILVLELNKEIDTNLANEVFSVFI